jgi:D-amino-acid oxidase
LQESGFSVRIVTRDLPPDTTSAIAAAVWYPYKAYPEDRVLAWGHETLDVCYDLADDPATGVSIKPLVELFDTPTPDPWWKNAVRQFRRATPSDLRPGYVDGFVIDVPVIETPIHLAYLVARFQSGGGTIEMVPEGIADLQSLRQPNRLLINCTGLGAKTLCENEAMFPIRGQVVRVRNPGINRCLIEDYGPLAMTYIIPRRHDVILGGTADDHADDCTPDPTVTDRILSNAATLEPRLRNAEVLDVKVGLRPVRSEVRLEIEDSNLLHNYGHGGSGFTLTWGCADEVVALAQSLLG